MKPAIGLDGLNILQVFVYINITYNKFELFEGGACQPNMGTN